MSERPRWLHGAILLLFAAYALAPVYLVILASLRSEGDLFAVPLSLPFPPDLSHYHKVWIEGGFGRFFLNSLFMSSCSTAIVILLAPAAGFAFAKLEFHGRETLFGLFLVGLVDLVLDPTNDDALEQLARFSRGSGLSGAIDCSGNAAAQNMAHDATGALGRVAFVGERVKRPFARANS